MNGIVVRRSPRNACSVALATLCLSTWAAADAAGQQPDYRASQHEIVEMQQRMEAYEAQLRALRVELGQQDPLRFTSMAVEAPGDKAPQESGPKKVDIITKPTVKVEGRIFADHLMIDQDPWHMLRFGDAENRTRFDTARLAATGDLWENMDYKLELAFGEQGPNTDKPTAKDVYFTFKELAYLQNVRIGHFKEPFSLEEMTSSRFITFMERSLLNTFAPARNMGIMAFGDVYPDQTLSWFTGMFRSEIDDDAVDESEDGADFASTSRVAWNPFYDEPSAGRYLAHLGAAYSFREYGDDTVTYNKDHELNLIFPLGNPVAINATGGPVILASNVQLFGAEAAVIYGPLHVESEWVHVILNGLGASPSGNFNTAYVEAGYFLTGENKGWRKQFHVFDRTKVLEPFFSVRTADGICRGRGAWELKARYSYIDANDNGIFGGRVGDVSAGLNWYANDYCRLMFDYIHGTAFSRPLSGLDAGECNELGMRAQVDF